MTYRFITLVLLSLGSLTVQAQDEVSTADEDVVEEIIVTGSRLPRRDFSSNSPIATIDSELLEATTLPNLEDTLNRMPQLAPHNDRTANNPGNGKAHINLRDMGAGRSLVLIDGQRMAPTGIGGAVDINALPKALIDRVEIITGGATTVYGSDAMAGVANFILRRDFEGLSVDLSSYVTEQGDSNVNDINVAFGHNFEDGRGNITLYAGFLDREETFGDARDITSNVLEDDWDGGIQESGSSRVPEGAVFAPWVDLGNGPSQAIFEPNGELRVFEQPGDLYNFAPVNYIQLPMERKMAGALFNYDLTDVLEVYGMLSYAESRVEQTLAPVPATDWFLINPDNPLLTPTTQQIAAEQFFPIAPGLVAFRFSRRLVELGPRIVDSNNEYARMSVGLRGEINETWDFDAWATYTKGDETVLFENDASFSRMQQGLLVDPVSGECMDPSGGCVPLDLFGAGNLSAEGLEFLRYEPFVNVTSRAQMLVSAFVRGAPFESWAGPVNMAFGIEWRSDDGSFQADEALFTGDTLGFGGDSSVDGKESVWEAYAELGVPLAQGTAWAEYLGLEIGGRISEYDNAGQVDTWKLGAEWQLPLPLRFRVMTQRSVRAPSVAEAFTEESSDQGSFVGFFSDNDPCSASRDPVGSGFADACIATGIPASLVGTWEATPGAPTDFYWGGNPDLGPETSETFTAGVVMDVDWLLGMQISVDYFDIAISDTIGGLDAIAGCFDVANTEQVFCERVIRDPITYDVSELRETNINKGGLQTSGIDTAINLQVGLPVGLALFGEADLDVDIVWTHVLENSYQPTPYGTRIECVGQFGWPCEDQRASSTFPTDRVLAGLNYNSGDFNMRLGVQWIDSVTNNLIENGWVFGLQGINWGNPSVKSMTYYDLSAGYQLSDQLTLRLNIDNLLDEDPPIHVHNWCCNTDPAYYDYFGRAYALSASVAF
jgi:outer membrane receptor protein involved in Fe transport